MDPDPHSTVTRGFRARRSFTVRPHLPTDLEDLRSLARNLRWSHDRGTLELFAAVAPEVWDAGVRDPAVLLARADQDHLAGLAGDPGFLDRLDAASRSLRESLATGAPGTGRGLVAYFSPEFGITEAIGQYSGGLGVLAGDHLRAAGELGIPMVAVGLFYRHGYFHQVLSPDGWQSERFVDNDPHTMPLVPLEERVEVDLAGEPLVLRAWKAMLGPVPIYLLDADLPENDPAARMVTDRLYGGDVEHRLRQEIVLGIGGVRLLEALGEPVEVFHTNEGHAGFMGLERIRTFMTRDELDLDTALARVRASSVFTTHTPVPAGMERFGRSLMERYFSRWASETGLGVQTLVELGHTPGEPPDSPFNMAVMGMRLSWFRNGVSRSHGETSRAMFGRLWPGLPTAEVPIGHVTNGVHPGTWLAPEMSELFVERLGHDTATGGTDWSGAGLITDHELRDACDTARATLVEVARQRLRSGALDAGRSPSELAWTDQALDPSTTTICFARRMATHKRAALLLEQPDRLRELLLDESRPVQFVFAGKAHTDDDEGKEMVRRLVAFASEPALRHRFVFLADYDMALARAMVQGADVWLNTPMHPLEASGTSGMKAALNGALNLSVLDGWWAEAFDAGSGPNGVPNGWAIAAPAAGTQPGSRDQARLDSNTLFELIENQVLPLAAEERRHRDSTGGTGRSSPWWNRVRHSLATLGPVVDAHRMSAAYDSDMYRPAAALSRALAAQDNSGARALSEFLGHIRADWDSLRVAAVDVDERDGDLGSRRRVVASVEPGRMRPEEIEVQLLVGHIGAGGELEEPTVTTMSPHGSPEPDRDGIVRYEGDAVLSVPGRMGLTVRAVPRHELLSTPLEPGLVAWAD